MLWILAALFCTAGTALVLLFNAGAHRKPTPRRPRCDRGEHQGISSYRFEEGTVTHQCTACGWTETRAIGEGR